MKSIMCPHLKGSLSEAVCGFLNTCIKNREDIDLRLCMHRHYEACSLYKMSLQGEESGSVLEDMMLGCAE